MASIFIVFSTYQVQYKFFIIKFTFIYFHPIYFLKVLSKNLLYAVRRSISFSTPSKSYLNSKSDLFVNRCIHTCLCMYASISDEKFIILLDPYVLHIHVIAASHLIGKFLHRNIFHIELLRYDSL